MSILRKLYFQVLLAVVAGVAFGHLMPEQARSLKWIGDAFVALVKMVIAPIIVCTIVHGIASMGDLRKVGRVGVRALLYFEAVSTLALVTGAVVGIIVRPGVGFGADVATLDPAAVAEFASAAAKDTFAAHLLSVIPRSYFDAMAQGELLQVLLIAILTGVAIIGMGDRRAPILAAVDLLGQIFFRIVGLVVRLAPLGAFVAMAFTVGRYGVASLGNLFGLMAAFYATSLVSVVIVLGGVARWCGFSILRFLVYIKDELLIVMGTASSETVLPQMMQKMEGAGASKSVVGLVIPTGYSFNLDGTIIYMTLTTLFLAQAMGVDLSFTQYATILLVAMLTSKGSSGVTGAGFITLAATLTAIPGHPIPVAAMTLVLGIDKFMSE